MQALLHVDQAGENGAQALFQKGRNFTGNTTALYFISQQTWGTYFEDRTSF